MLVVLASFIVMVVGLYTAWKIDTIAGAWVPVSMFVLGILVPIYWLGSLVLGIILGAIILIAPSPTPSLRGTFIPIFTSLTFTELLKT